MSQKTSNLLMAQSVEDNHYQTVEGINFHRTHKEQNIRQALNFRPRDGDIALYTYMKCGTTWTQNIICHLLHYGQFDGSFPSLNTLFPFLEIAGTDDVISKDIKLQKTHLPFDTRRWNPNAKYILVIRNPRDVCVSLYYHYKGHPLQIIPKHLHDLGVFVDYFVKGKVFGNDYFDYYLSWHEKLSAKNVLLLVYEKMKEDPMGSIKKIGEFIGGKAAENARNEEILNDILSRTSVAHMQQCINPGFREKMFEMLNVSMTAEDKKEEFKFVRKGEVGDWKNHFTPDMAETVDKWITSNPRNALVMKMLE